MKRIFLMMAPLEERATWEARVSVLVWNIIARSTSSKCPSRMSSALPERNSSSSRALRRMRPSTSIISSAGTAKNTSEPPSAGNTAADSSPMAAPTIPAT